MSSILSEASVVNVFFAISALYNTAIYIPQIIRLIKIKTSQELSLRLFLFFCIAQVIAVLYGIFVAKDLEYTIAAFMVLTAILITTCFIIYYRVHSQNRYSASSNLLKHFKKYFILYLLGFIILILLVSLVIIPSVQLTFRRIIVFLFYLTFLFVAFSFVVQILKILTTKHAKEFSLTTFLGFNFIQIVTAIYAYFYHIPVLLFGMILYLMTSGVLTLSIVYYKWKNKEF